MPKAVYKRVPVEETNAVLFAVGAAFGKKCSVTHCDGAAISATILKS